MAVPPIFSTLIIQQGTTWQRRWLITDPDSDAPRDLSGWTARGQIRIHQADVGPVFEWQGSGITCDEDGYVTVSVTPDQSSTWNWRDGYYDIELVDPSDQVVRIAQGYVRVSPEVTR